MVLEKIRDRKLKSTVVQRLKNDECVRLVCGGQPDDFDLVLQVVNQVVETIVSRFRLLRDIVNKSTGKLTRVLDPLMRALLSTRVSPLIFPWPCDDTSEIVAVIDVVQLKLGLLLLCAPLSLGQEVRFER